MNRAAGTHEAFVHLSPLFRGRHEAATATRDPRGKRIGTYYQHVGRRGLRWRRWHGWWRRLWWWRYRDAAFGTFLHGARHAECEHGYYGSVAHGDGHGHFV